MTWLLGSKNGSALTLSSIVIAPLAQIEQEIKRRRRSGAYFGCTFLWKIQENGTLILDRTTMIDLKLRDESYRPGNTPHV